MKPEPRNTPALRFPEFEGNLVDRPLSDIVVEHNSGIYKSASLYGFGANIVGVSDWYSISSIDGQTFNMVPLTGEELSKFSLDEGDLIYGESSLVREGIAKTLYVTGKGAGTAFEWHTRRFKVDLKVVVPSYVHYNLEAPAARRRIMRVATQTALTGITTKDYFATTIYLPNKSEQQKIAAFLSAVDERIRQLARKKELLLKYKKGVLEQIFSQKIRFKDESGNDFPDWEEKNLGTVAQYIRNGLSLNQESGYVGVKVTRIETISDGTINLEKVGFIKTEEDISDYRLQVGDILFSNINSVAHIGKMAYVDQEYDLYHGMNLLNIRFDRKRHNSRFFYFLMETFGYRKHFQRICNRAVNQASINQTDLKKTQLLVPCLDEQSKIASFLDEIDKKISLVSQQVGTTNTFKMGLLQQMFV